MRFRKRLNNNVVVAVGDDGAEQVLFGRGLGFDLRNGEAIDMSRVEKTYVLADDPSSQKLQQLLAMISIEYVDVAQQIFERARATLPVPISDGVVLPLADHVHMAVSRARQGIDIRNMMLLEIRRFYRDEFLVGQYSTSLINERFGTSLADDEAGFIALHLVNAVLGSGEGTTSLTKITDVIKEIERIVRMHYAREINVESDQYRRFATHLKFFAERLFQDRIHRNDDVSRMLTAVSETYPEATGCVSRIGNFLAARHGHDMSDDERLYLTIHVAHVMDHRT